MADLNLIIASILFWRTVCEWLASYSATEADRRSADALPVSTYQLVPTEW